MEFLLKPGYLLATALVGAFAHFLKKNVKGETLTEIGRYFHDNVKSTLLAIIVTLVSTVGYIMTLQTGTPADFVTVFLLGFGVDSTLNKWGPAE